MNSLRGCSGTSSSWPAWSAAFPPLYEASHDRYTALVGHLQMLYGAMTALKGVLRFEQQLRQSTPHA